MRNYYALQPKELDYWIEQMKGWLFLNHNHPRKDEVSHALNVAYAAKRYNELLVTNSDIAMYNLLFTQNVVE